MLVHQRVVKIVFVLIYRNSEQTPQLEDLSYQPITIIGWKNDMGSSEKRVTLKFSGLSKLFRL